MKTDIEISGHDLEEVADLLNTLLADEYVLYTKTRKVHWYIERLGLHDLHRFFERQILALDVIIDDVAERGLSLGNAAPVSLKNFLKITHLSESDDDFSGSDQLIQLLLDDHESIIRILEKEIPALADTYKDPGTSDFIAGVMVKHEEIARMLSACLS